MTDRGCARRRSSARSARPARARLLGVELGGPHVVPARPRRRPARRSRTSADHVGSSARRRRSGRSTPTPGRRARRAAATVARTSSTFHCICGPLHPVGQQPHRAGQDAEPGGAGALLGALEEQLHADADAEERPPGVDGLERELRRGPRSRSASMHRPKAPTPGSTTRVGARPISRGSAVRRASAPTRSSAFCAERRLPMP